MGKRVLLVHADDLRRGGGEAFILDWIKSDLIQQYQYIWYSFGEVKDSEYLNEIKPYILQFIDGNNRKYNKIEGLRRFYIDLCRITKKYKFDIIHIHAGAGSVQIAWVAVMVAHIQKIPRIIVHSHSTVKQTNIIKIFSYVLMRPYLLSRATWCVGCSKEAGIALFGKNVLNSPKWKYVQNTVNVKKFSFNEKIRVEYREKCLAKSKIIMGCVGNADENKNQIFALRLIKELEKNKMHQFVLLLIGQDGLNGELQKEAEKFGIKDKVFFLGACNCVEKWLQAMDIFLMPSKSEGMPIAALEAQVAGLSCILSDRISKEVKITNHVKFASIDNVVEWVNAVEELAYLTYNREEESELACNSGIDNSQILQYKDCLYETLPPDSNS